MQCLTHSAFHLITSMLGCRLQQAPRDSGHIMVQGRCCLVVLLYSMLHRIQACMMRIHLHTHRDMHVRATDHKVQR
jgi:hypothetical protein